MVDGRRDAAWWHTANLMALTAEINRSPKQRPRPFTAMDFHPLHRGRKPVMPKGDIGMLKVFLKPKPKE